LHLRDGQALSLLWISLGAILRVLTGAHGTFSAIGQFGAERSWPTPHSLDWQLCQPNQQINARHVCESTAPQEHRYSAERLSGYGIRSWLGSQGQFRQATSTDY
jgi:hypothetical protein